MDILVNAAGLKSKKLSDTSLEEWNLIFAVNVTAFLVSKMVALDAQDWCRLNHQFRVL